jgi:hypothetical protein
MIRSFFNRESGWKCLLFLIGFSYFVAWMIAGYPYRAVPCDDTGFIFFARALGFPQAIHSPYPVTLLLLKEFDRVWNFLTFSLHPDSSLLFMSVFENTGILLLVGFLTWELTRRPIAGCLASLVYAFNAWPAQYHTYYSYTTTSIFFSIFSFYYLIKGYLRYTSPQPSGSAFFLSLAGLALGLFFWSGASGMVMVFFQGVAFLVLFRHALFRRQFLPFWAYAVPFLLVIFIFSLNSGKPLWDHFGKNLGANHDIRAIHLSYTPLEAKYGVNPRMPLFTLLHMGLKVYTPYLLLAFWGAALLYGSLRIFRRVSGVPTSSGEKALSVLAIIAFAHPLIIDFLPFTKLARAHFGVLPYLVAATVAMVFLLLDLEFLRGLRIVRPALAAVLIAVFCYDARAHIGISREIRRVRTSAPEMLQPMLQDIELYMVREDPHAVYICRWLRGLPITVTNVNRIGQIRPTPGKKIGLLFGPVGEYSSRVSSINMAFPTDIPGDIFPDRQPLRLPYFSTLPCFMMEQEVCEALFFQGRVTDYRKDTQQLSLYIFDRIEKKDIEELTLKFKDLSVWPPRP